MSRFICRDNFVAMHMDMVADFPRDRPDHLTLDDQRKYAEEVWDKMCANDEQRTNIFVNYCIALHTKYKEAPYELA